MRIIDADALHSIVARALDVNEAATDVTDAVEQEHRVLYWLLEKIEEQTIISPDEVRGVVHCKDCKWCHAGYCEKYDDLIPWGCTNKPWEDWFCADGKRREITKEAQDAD